MDPDKPQDPENIGEAWRISLVIEYHSTPYLTSKGFRVQQKGPGNSVNPGEAWRTSQRVLD